MIETHRIDTGPTAKRYPPLAAEKKTTARSSIYLSNQTVYDRGLDEEVIYKKLIETLLRGFVGG